MGNLLVAEKENKPHNILFLEYLLHCTYALPQSSEQINGNTVNIIRLNKKFCEIFNPKITIIRFVYRSTSGIYL